MIPGFERMEMRETEYSARNQFEDFDPDKRVEVRRTDRQSVEAYTPDKRVEVLYTSREERMRFAERTDGTWSGEHGNSRIRPNTETLLGKAAHDKLQEFDLDDIEYRNGVVDFSRCAVESVDIGRMTKHRDINRGQAFAAVAKKWNSAGRLQDDGRLWTADAVGKWASANNLQFHECSNMKTCQFVPGEIHSYFKHYGGIAECKARDALVTGGGFDE